MSSAAPADFNLGKPQRCTVCGSDRNAEMLGEICLHFAGGLDSLHKAQIWAFPHVVLCLDCGSAQFTLPEKELNLVRGNL
jgi:hypothetical protein